MINSILNCKLYRIEYGLGNLLAGFETKLKTLVQHVIYHVKAEKYHF